MHLPRLEDSPVFGKQLLALEESAEALRERCQKFYKWSHKYTEGLGEAYDADIAFASALDTFGGGHDDTISVAVGGPVMSKFTIALREIGTYKEVLRSQVEHMLNDRLMQFVRIDLQDMKEARKRFDKASLHYDQVREKFLSLKKGTKSEIVLETEEDLCNARSTFEQARFNLVTTLSNIEAKTKFEFLEAISGAMDAHLRYFKQGYELLHQMEPYIHQVLIYAQQSRARTNFEQATLADGMQEFRRQMDWENRCALSDVKPAPIGGGIQTMGKNSHKMIAAVMESATRGKIQIIKQGYLLKHSSSLRGDWKRRFFVLDSRGRLYYYRKHWGKAMEGSMQPTDQCCLRTSDHNPGILGRFLSSRHRSPQNDKILPHHTVNLLTATIKVDAEQTDLRFCFRIISPLRIYSLQAENTMDQMDWIDKISGVIASLLSSQIPDQVGYSQRLWRSPMGSAHQRTASESSSLSSYSGFDHSIPKEPVIGKSCQEQLCQRLMSFMSEQQERPIDVLRRVPGNDVCADCNSPEPDWASLNLGILLCIECSGVHRNLGVHISKVRSLTLDVRVWGPSVIDLFQSVGNLIANSVWEELIPKLENRRQASDAATNNTTNRIISNEERHRIEISHIKPDARDLFSIKEKYIYAKYAEKRFVAQLQYDPKAPSVACQLWDAVKSSNKQVLYYLIVKLDADTNVTYEQATASAQSALANVISESVDDSSQNAQSTWNGPINNCSSTILDSNLAATIKAGEEWNMQGSTLLHLACQVGDLGTVELLLQHGAEVNASDKLSRTPLHHCILHRQIACAKLLLTRGAKPSVMDRQGTTPLQIAIKMGTATDQDLFIMLSETNK